MINSKYPKASEFAQWALQQVNGTLDPEIMEYEGKLYQTTYKAWKGRLNKNGKARVVLEEIGKERVYLVNDDLRQLWIEHKGGRIVHIGDSIHEVSQCCRCKCELDDERLAKLNACEDCWNTDAETLLQEFARGDW